MCEFMIRTLPAWMMFTPLVAVRRPSMSRPSSVTRSFTPALTMIPLETLVRTPAMLPWFLIVIAFVIVTAPKPPGSRTLISPWAAVFEIAPAKVLQGAVRLHGLASSPTPDTHVRVAWAEAEAGRTAAASSAAAARMRGAIRRERYADPSVGMEVMTASLLRSTAADQQP